MGKFLTKKSTIFFALLAAAMLTAAFMSLYIKDERELAQIKNTVNSVPQTATPSPAPVLIPAHKKSVPTR